MSPSATGDVPSAGKGATLVGTVETGGVGASSVHALSGSDRSGIRVTVMGLSLSTTTDENGRFVFTGLPTGQVEVRFEGPGIDARVQISGLVEGQTLTIAVQVSGGRVQIVGPDREVEVEIRGPVESVTPPTLRVLGRTVRTDATTRVRGRREETIALSTIKVGDLVKVEGVLLSDGTILARRVDLEEEDEREPDEDEVEFTGMITSKGASSLTVAGRNVIVDGNTRIRGDHGDPISFTALQVGQTVEVEGQPRSDGSVLAEKIKLED